MFLNLFAAQLNNTIKNIHMSTQNTEIPAKLTLSFSPLLILSNKPVIFMEAETPRCHTQAAKGEVCKTFIHRFESDWHLYRGLHKQSPVYLRTEQSKFKSSRQTQSLLLPQDPEKYSYHNHFDSQNTQPFSQ